jgi:hypothetical protein
MPVEMLEYSLVAAGKMRLRRRNRSAWDSKQEDGCIDKPISKSNAAGFKSSKELSSFSGVRHFWQYIFDAEFLVALRVSFVSWSGICANMCELCILFYLDKARTRLHAFRDKTTTGLLNTTSI